MKYNIFASMCMPLMLTITAMAQPVNNNPWTGMWQGELDGKPGVILTLAEDSGVLGGTVVFNMVHRDGDKVRVIGSDPHVLLHPRLLGDTLLFEVIRKSDARTLEISVKPATEGKAYLKCLNCGPDSPSAEIEKVDWQ